MIHNERHFLPPGLLKWLKIRSAMGKIEKKCTEHFKHYPICYYKCNAILIY